MYPNGIQVKIRIGRNDRTQTVFNLLRLLRIADNAPGIIKTIDHRHCFLKQFFGCNHEGAVQCQRTMTIFKPIVYEQTGNNGVVVTDSEDHLLSMFYGYTPAVGDVLTFESMDGKAIEVTIMGIAKPSVTSGTGAWGLFTLTEELADQLYPDIGNREAVWNVHTSEDSDALRASIFSLLENPVLTVFSRADHAASLESQLKMMTRGVYLLLAFLFVFSMVNLVNTLMTNLLARQQELGILQSVGMTGKQVSRMLIAECLWYAGVTVFLSVGIGGILGWIFDYVISSFHIFGELSYQFPLMETVVFVLALLVVTGIFSVVAVRYSKRLSLVERIKTMD